MEPTPVLEHPKSTCESNKKASKNNHSKKIFNFLDARKIARGHGFASVQEFLDYDCAGAYSLPKNVDELYKDDGWVDWDDFLGIPFKFEKGRVVARGLGLLDRDSYLKYMRGVVNHDEEARRLPYQPDLYYKKEWISWEDWLMFA